MNETSMRPFVPKILRGGVYNLADKLPRFQTQITARTVLSALDDIFLKRHVVCDLQLSELGSIKLHPQEVIHGLEVLEQARYITLQKRDNSYVIVPQNIMANRYFYHDTGEANTSIGVNSQSK